MSNKTITMQLELDGQPTPYHRQAELMPNFTYYFEIPCIDLKQYACARIRITTADAKEEP